MKNGAYTLIKFSLQKYQLLHTCTLNLDRGGWIPITGEALFDFIISFPPENPTR